MTVTKVKTDNDLEERFQWHKGLDPDHIFEDEYVLIKKLRDQIPELAKETDKFCAVFLFARRHNIEDTVTLLKKFYKKKAEFQHMFPGQHIPSFKYNAYLTNNVVAGGGAMIHSIGKADNKDRMLRYFYMGIDKPSGRVFNETYPCLFWQTYFQIQTEPLNIWRNGVAIVVDLKGAGLNNIDISSKGRELNSALQGTFPFRIRAMYVVNGGWVISALLTAAKIALPKKLYERIKLMDQSELKNMIPPSNLTPQYGGTSTPFTYKEFLAEIAKTEEELFEKGIWKAPDGASSTPAAV